MLMQKRSFLARDGIRLAYDDFSPQSVVHAGKDESQHSGIALPKACLIFLHGSTYNARRYANIAKASLKQGYQVCLLNWRGHGESGGKPGDLDYVGQLEDDLNDMIVWVKQQHPERDIVIGGHSAGAVVCLRYIDRYGCDDIKAVSIVSPAINGPLETVRYSQASSVWQYKLTYFRKANAIEATPEAALQHAPVLNMGAFWLAKLMPFLRNRTILNFPASERLAQLEGRVLGYSYNLMLSCDINAYPRAFNKIRVPVFLLVGEEDEVIHPHLLTTVYHWHLSPSIAKSLIKVPKANHIRILPAACNLLPSWLDEVLAVTLIKESQTQSSDAQAIKHAELALDDEDSLGYKSGVVA
jgi:alpha-beta hydrolase superfamily lysophospholipase